MTSPPTLQRFVINIFIICGFGIAFTILMPGIAGQSSFEFDKPIYMALLALLGDFDMSRVSEYYASTAFWERPTPNVMSILLLFYAFLAAVVLVNLLIALMSHRFEKLQEKASEIWLFERLRLYKEYKDERDAIPPPLNSIPLLYLLFKACFRRCRDDPSRRLNGFKLPNALKPGEWEFVQFTARLTLHPHPHHLPSISPSTSPSLRTFVLATYAQHTHTHLSPCAGA